MYNVLNVNLLKMCLCLGVIMFWFFPGLGGDNRVRYIKAFNKRYVYASDVARYYGMKYKLWRNSFELSSKYSRLVFHKDKKEFLLSGVKTYLLYPPFIRGGHAYISEADFLKVIDPALRPRALKPHGMKVIMLDPGHGGKDQGGKGRSYREKDIVLRLAWELRKELRKYGYTVYMTRTSDRFIELADRSAIAKKYGADLFISIHGNITKDKSIHGIETFCITPAGAPSTYDRPGRGGARTAGNANGKNSLKLAYEIQKGTVASTGAVDRGVKHARFVVLKNAPCPAILFEAGFLSNRREELSLANSAYRAKIIRGIVSGIIKYHRQLLRAR